MFFTLPDFTNLDFLFLMASLLSTNPAKDVLTISGASSHFLLWALVAKCICVATHMCIHAAAAAAAKSLQSCPTLCDPIGSSPPGSPIPGILQARTLEQVAISFSNA